MASLNEGRKKSNFGTKRGAGNVDRTTSRSNMQDPSKTTPSKGGRQVPMPNLSKTVEQTPANKYIRSMQDKGIRVNQDFVDAQGVKASGAKPVKVGKSKPTVGQGQVNRTRAKGQAAAAGVNVTPEPSRRAPRNIPLGDTTRGGPVKTMKLGDVGAPSKSDAVNLQRMTTASPEQSKALQRNLDTSIEKPKAVKQSVVSKRAERFRQSFGTPTGANPLTGAPTYKPISTTSDLPKGVGGRAPSSRQYSKVKIGDLTPTVKPTKAVLASTKTKVKLPKLNVTTLPAQPSTTIRRRSGNAGPSSKLNAGKFTPQKSTTRAVTTSKEPTLDLGRKTQVKTRTGSVSYKPEKYKVSSKYSPLSVAGDVAYGGIVGYDAYQKAKARGQSDAYAYKQAATQGGTTAAASAAGSALGRKIGSKLPGPGWVKALGIGAGDWIGGATGGYLGQTSSPGIVGASKSDKKWMQWANRSVQQGTPAQAATSKSGNRAIVRDAKGNERVGYRAYKDGKAVYKHGNDPSSLQYTSSNPLERIGRTVGSSGGLGPVSDLIKGYYSRKDTATRTANVAAQRSRASK